MQVVIAAKIFDLLSPPKRIPFRIFIHQKYHRIYHINLNYSYTLSLNKLLLSYFTQLLLNASFYFSISNLRLL